MKKILSLLTAITLTAGASTSVISCSSAASGGGSSNTKERDIIPNGGKHTKWSDLTPVQQETATDIANKLNNANISLSSQYNNKSLKDATQAVKNAIINKNILTSIELDAVAFTNNPVLSKDKTNSINFEVNYKDKKATGSFNINIFVTNLTAQQIVNKIDGKNIELDQQDVGKTAAQIKDEIISKINALKIKGLDIDALSYISFTDQKIQDGKNSILFKVTKDGVSPEGHINGNISHEGDKTAKEIASLINIKDDLYLPNYINPDTSNKFTIEQLKTALFNSSSQQFDNSNNINKNNLKYISFEKTSLKKGFENTITAIVTKDQQSASVKLKALIVNDNKKEKTYRPYIDIGQLQTLHMDLTNLYTQGIDHVMMAFIQTKNVNNVNVPAWAGDTPIFNPQGAASKAALAYYDGQISSYQKIGGKVGISFGGANGVTIWQDQKSDAIYNNLKKITDKYKPDMLDFDIEGTGLTDKTGVRNLVTALNQLLNQKGYQDIKVGLTISADPGLETGLNPQFINPNNVKNPDLNSVCGALSYLKIPTKPIVNAMSMDFGGQSWLQYHKNHRGADMYEGNIELPDKVSKAIYSIWKQNSEYKGTEADIRNNFGLTPMFGQNDTAAEIFFKEDAAKLSNWANNGGNIKWIGGWSLTRDHVNYDKQGNPQLGKGGYNNTGVLEDQYGFSTIFDNLYINPSNGKKPIDPSAKLNTQKYLTAPTAMALTWTKIDNAINYRIYVDGKLVSTTLNNGYYYQSPDLKAGSHNVQIEAIGVQGSSVSQNLSVNIPTAQGTKWNPTGVCGAISMFKDGVTYHAGDTVFYKDSGKWILRYIKQWHNKDVWSQWDHKDLGPVSDFLGEYISPQLYKDLQNGQLPSWFPTGSFNH